MHQKPPHPFDPEIIRNSPLELPEQDFNLEESEFYLRVVADLSEQNASLKAENERLKGEKSLESVKAGLLTPYANKVFYFLCAYCFFVFFLLLLSGGATQWFRLPMEVLTVLSGSTAVAAIGLVGIVVRGLFSSR